MATKTKKKQEKKVFISYKSYSNTEGRTYLLIPESQLKIYATEGLDDLRVHETPDKGKRVVVEVKVREL